MPRIDHDQKVNSQGVVYEDVQVSRPAPKVSAERFHQIKSELRNVNQPLTLPQMRLLLTEIVQYLSNEMDDEP